MGLHHTLEKKKTIILCCGTTTPATTIEMPKSQFCDVCLLCGQKLFELDRGLLTYKKRKEKQDALRKEE